MIHVRRLPVGQLQTNCYLVIDESKCIIIDPGDDADYIQRIIADEGVQPLTIVATHGHYDHILAVSELKLAYGIPFLMHKKDEFLLSRMNASAKRFSKIKSDPPPKVDQYLTKDFKLTITHYSLFIIHTPGHTPGSISLYNKETKSVFVGDLIFDGGGVGRTDFAYSSSDDLKNSVKKILKFPPKTKVYSGHGNETTIKKLINVKYN